MPAVITSVVHDLAAPVAQYLGAIDRWLLTGLVLAFTVFMIYWVAALVEFGAPWEFVLLPLAMVILGALLGLPWLPWF